MIKKVLNSYIKKKNVNGVMISLSNKFQVNHLIKLLNAKNF